MASMLRRAGKSVVRSFALVGGVYAVSEGARVYSRNETLKKEKGVPKILHLDFSTPIKETKPAWKEQFLEARPALQLSAVVEAIDKAATDVCVKGVVCTFGGEMEYPVASVQEIRDAISRFREAQKALPEVEQRFSYATADTFGEAGQGSREYYLASSCQKVFVQPSGHIGLIGISLPSYFLRGFLDKIGVELQFFKFHEFKNAPNMFTETGYTEAHRAQTALFGGCIFDQMVGGIAASRGLSIPAVRALVDRAPILATDAVTSGLVDGVMYRDQVLDLLPDNKVVPLRAYIKELADIKKAKEQRVWPGSPAEGTPEADKLTKNKPHIALITAAGSIGRGQGGRDQEGVYSEAVCSAIREAAKSKIVKAIVMRVDSPGGSAVASDSIRRELEYARSLGKPVVVSMGAVAASGGYYIATAADKVVAQPGTITGSIGAFSGKLMISGMLEKLGVGFDRVSFGEDADALDPTVRLSPKQAEKTERLGRKVYDDFVGLVAAARGMTLDEVDKVARGRVWTGKQAKDLNLVDELGGLTKAREVAGTLVGQKDGDPPLDLVPYPKEKSIAQKLAQAVTGGDQGKNTISLSADTDSFGGLVGVVRGVLQGSGMHDVAEAWSAVAKVGGVLRAARGGEAQGVQLRAETDTRL